MSAQTVIETRTAIFNFCDSSGKPVTVTVNGKTTDHHTRNFAPGIPDESIASWWAETAAHHGRMCAIKKTESTRERVTFTVVESDKTR